MKLLNKQMKENGVHLFYSNSSAFCLSYLETAHCTTFGPIPIQNRSFLTKFSLVYNVTHLCIFDIIQCKKKHGQTKFL